MTEKVYRLLEDAANLVERTVYDFGCSDATLADVGEVRGYCRGILTALHVMYNRIKFIWGCFYEIRNKFA